jgi:hypothetical protein
MEGLGVAFSLILLLALGTGHWRYGHGRYLALYFEYEQHVGQQFNGSLQLVTTSCFHYHKAFELANDVTSFLVDAHSVPSLQVCTRSK